MGRQQVEKEYYLTQLTHKNGIMPYLFKINSIIPSCWYDTNVPEDKQEAL